MKEIVGLRRYSFTDQRTGEAVEGYVVHLQYKDDKTEGICCECHSISVFKLDGYIPQIGDCVRIGMNRYGKVDFIVKVG